MSEGTPVENAPPPAAQPPRGALRVIFFIVLMDLLGFGIIIPLAPFYIPDYQNHPIEVTLLFSVYSICQFIGAPILGLVSDRFGRKPVLGLSQIGSALGYVLLGLSAHRWHTASAALVLVYLSRLVDGFTGGNISTAQAYVSDVTTPENRAKGMGVLGAAFGVGFAAGPALGGLMGHYLGLAAPGYIAAGLAALAAFLSFTRLPETRARTEAEAEAWLHPSRFVPIFRKPVLVQLLAISFLIMAAFVMMESTITLFLNKLFGWQELGVGLYFVFIGFMIVVIQGGLIGRLTKKLGDWPLAIGGPVLVALGMFGLTGVAFAVSIALLLLAGAINATGRSFQQPTISSLISKFAARNEQGAVFGLYHGLSSLARVAGPLVAGLAYPYLHNTLQYLIAAAIALAMAAWTAALRQPAPAEDAPAARAEAALETG